MKYLTSWITALLAVGIAMAVQADHKVPGQSVFGHHDHHGQMEDVKSKSTDSTMATETGESEQANTLEVAAPVTIYRPLPGKNMTVAYPVISNATATSRTLQSITADWAERVEIHTHEHHLGMMRMRRVEELVLEPKTEYVFKPGGLHLMVFGVQPTLPTEPSLTFCYDQQECLTVIGQLEDF